MCFTVNVNIVKEELEKRYGSELLDHENYRPSYYYHAFSFPELPVVTRRNTGDNQLSLFRWGLIPSWTRSDEDAAKIKGMTLNARSESISEKPAFSKSFSKRRCLVPVKGFYEWKHENGKKIPYYIYHPEMPVMSLGALFDRWNIPGGGEVYSFSIITTSSNTMMSEIHNSKRRMPVIINPDGEEDWLYQGTSPLKLKELMNSYPDNILHAHTVSPMITNSRINRNNEEITKPYSYPHDQTLL